MDEIFRISKDSVRAKDLFEMAEERMNDIISVIPKDKHYKFIEEYYEVIVQLITALMYLDGFKTLSHIGLIDYLSKNYKEFTSSEIKLIDILRKFRHGTVYYGKKVGSEFLLNYNSDIESLISKLNKTTKRKF